jgi:hypothetical protein
MPDLCPVLTLAPIRETKRPIWQKLCPKLFLSGAIWGVSMAPRLGIKRPEWIILVVINSLSITCSQVAPDQEDVLVNPIPESAKRFCATFGIDQNQSAQSALV